MAHPTGLWSHHPLARCPIPGFETSSVRAGFCPPPPSPGESSLPQTTGRDPATAKPPTDTQHASGAGQCRLGGGRSRLRGSWAALLGQIWAGPGTGGCQSPEPMSTVRHCRVNGTGSGTEGPGRTPIAGASGDRSLLGPDPPGPSQPSLAQPSPACSWAQPAHGRAG